MRRFVFGVMALVALAMAGGPTQAATVYYNLFNREGEDVASAGFVTYATLADMLNDENRVSVNIPDGSGGFGRNIVGTGSDGTTYWNLFNREGEDVADAGFVTYSAFEDMLNDENRVSVVIPDGSGGFGRNVVGTGSDGTTYWNLFNREGEDVADAGFVTYATLADMLNDENRVSVVIPDGSGGFGRNIVGTGAFFAPDAPPPPVVPLPASAWLMVAGLGALVAARGRPRNGQPRHDRR